MYESDRTFRVWGFTHHDERLLLRSLPDERGVRVDVAFRGVAEMSLTSTESRGLTITSDSYRYELEGLGWVVAAGFVVDETTAVYSQVFSPPIILGKREYVAIPKGAPLEKASVAAALKNLLFGWKEGYLGPRLVMEEAERLVYLLRDEWDAWAEHPIGLCLTGLSRLHIELFTESDVEAFALLLNDAVDPKQRIQQWELAMKAVDFDRRAELFKDHSFYWPTAVRQP